MKKITSEQQKAIEGLVCMLDELSNKPRRLFTELSQVAIAFLNTKRTKRTSKQHTR